MKQPICSGLFCWLLLCPAQAGEKPATVFEIGAPDGDYHEFAIAGKYADYSKRFSKDVDFTAGQSDPRRDWPYILPGPGDAWAGSRPHSFKIRFQIPQLGTGFYRLVIDFVSTHPARPPVIAVKVNGEKLECKTSPGGPDAALTNPRDGKSSSIQQLIPLALFRSGENTIELTSVGGSWALFDDVRLESGLPAPKETLKVDAEPLPFFKRGVGGVERGLKISIDNLEAAAAPAELAWSSNGRSGSQKFELRFGQNDLQVEVPDVERLDLALKIAQREIKMPVTLPPARKWRVYIVPTTHTDVGYTDLQNRVKVRHSDNGLRALGWLNEYPFFKWYSETVWQLEALLELHPDKAEEVFSRLREKRMGLSGGYANILTGLCSCEALNRVALDSRKLARRGGFDVNSVILNDVPSAVDSLPMVLAQSGIKYFIEGVNRDRAPYSAEGLPGPFYWQGPDGSRVLSHIAPGYAIANWLLSSVQQATGQLPGYLARYDTPEYPYDVILINGAFTDNAVAQAWLPETVRLWNAQWEYPKLILAQPEDFFGHIETHFSNSIPVLQTDFGCWWEDGAGSSALETALSRRAEERVVTAEMLHSLAVLLRGAAYPKTNFDGVWRNILLYNEHTWGAAGSIREPKAEQTVKQWAVKSACAHQADSESRALLASGLDELAAMIPATDLVVFNQLAWPRTAVVNTDIAGALQDVETGRVHPCQPLPEGGSCFVAESLPSIGYRSYRKATATEPAPDAVQVSGHQMENEFYRVTLDPRIGGIQSIYDKQIGRELVDSNSEYALGELIYVSGGEGGNAGPPVPRFESHRQTATGIKPIVGPVFGELASESTADHFPRITLRVRLYRGLKQLDLICELDKQETPGKEAVYLAFPFAFDTAKGGLWLEYPDAITEPLRDQHKSACRDWYSVQRWLAVSDGEATVELSPLDAPLFTLGHLTASSNEIWRRHLSLERGHVFAYLMNNHWHTNYKATQGGRFVFRYSLTSTLGGFSKHDAVVKGWGMFCPPAAGRGRGAGKPLFAAPAKSLVGVAPAGLPLTAMKEAEDKDGFIFRLCDLAGEGGTARLTLPKPASEVSICNLVEAGARRLTDRDETVAIPIPIKSFAPVTLRARFAP